MLTHIRKLEVLIPSEDEKYVYSVMLSDCLIVNSCPNESNKHPNIAAYGEQSIRFELAKALVRFGRYYHAILILQSLKQYEEMEFESTSMLNIDKVNGLFIVCAYKILKRFGLELSLEGN